MPKQQNSFLRELHRRCNWLVTQPQLFPELYADPQAHALDGARQRDAKIVAEHCRLMDLESQRVGTPRDDSSVYGLGEKNIALRTGLGDPRVQTKNGHWRGRRVIQRSIHTLREAGILFWGDGELIKKGLACNPRFEIKKGPKAGTWRLYPSVRRVAKWFIAGVKLDRRLTAEIEDLQRRRAAGTVDQIVDVYRRRARDRGIKARQRNRAREERLFVAERERTIAASQRTPRRIE